MTQQPGGHAPYPDSNSPAGQYPQQPPAPGSPASAPPGWTPSPYANEQSPYGTPPAPPQQQQYPPQQYPAYPQDPVKPASYGYPQQPPVPRSGKPKRNPVFGIVSFIVVLAATIGGSVLMYRIGDLMRPFMSAYVQTESMDVFQTVQPALEANSVGVMGVSLIGTIAWALCIAATVRNSARPAAIFGIVIGALAPFIIVAAGVMGAIG